MIMDPWDFHSINVLRAFLDSIGITPECAKHFPLHDQSTTSSLSDIIFSVQLWSNGFRWFRVVSPYFHSYLVGHPGFTHCPNIPCTYINCCSSCYNGHSSHEFWSISASLRDVIILLNDDHSTSSAEFRWVKLFIMVNLFSAGLFSTRWVYQPHIQPSSFRWAWDRQ